MDLQELVKDWGGFEDFVKDLHCTGDVDVEKDVTLIGSSGAPRQIDVLLKHKKGPYQYLTLIECKYWKKKVERSNIDVLHSSMLDLNASKGAFFTTKGYQSGAEVYAKSKGIDIFVIRELTDEEWGLPGKVLDFYLQIMTKTILGINVLDSQAALRVGSKQKIQNSVSINLGGNSPSKHLIVSKHKSKYKTLEEYIDAASYQAVKEIQKKRFLINNGEDCVRYFSIKVNMPFCDDALHILNGDTLIIVQKIELSVGIEINQSRLVIDRSKNYIYSLAIENCVSNQVYATSKKEHNLEIEWNEIPSNKSETSEEVLFNGSILSVIRKGYFCPSEMDGLIEKPKKIF